MRVRRWPSWCVRMPTWNGSPVRPLTRGSGGASAAQRLVAAGRGTTWIAAQLGVTKQAVDGFLRYKERKGR